MKLKDMIPELRYVVTKGGTSLKKGDHIWVHFDGFLMCIESIGWLMPQEWKLLRNEVELDKEFYEEEIKKAEARIKLYRSYIEKYGKR